MELHYLRLFHVAASAKNLTEAANSLYLTQPALSMQLKKFEQNLGIKLFDRVGTRNVLNENGQLLYGYTQQIFSLIDEANCVLQKNKDLITGQLVIGGSNTSGTYILPKMIGIFKRMYPSVNINLHVADTSEITRLVIENKLDFAINGGLIEYGRSISCERLLEEKMIFVTAPNSRLAKKKRVKIDELKDISFISHERQSQLYLMTERILKLNHFPCEITMTFNNIDAIKQAVEADLGISLIPYSAVRNELQTDLISEFVVEDQSWQYPQNLIYNKNRHHSPAALRMMAIVKDNIANFKY